MTHFLAVKDWFFAARTRVERIRVFQLLAAQGW
jgi:hypothetical protein